MRAFIALVVSAAAALPAAAAFAQDEHHRRLGAELLIMAGDLRRLSAAETPAAQREGVRARLAGALSTLPWLLRLAGAPAASAAPLRTRFGEGNYDALARELAALAARHPLDTTHILTAAPTPEGIAHGRAIHEEACAGCHDTPAGDGPLPARDLREEARRLPPEEFAARLINGIRGDATTALANPFGDAAIAALIAFYRE